MASCGLGDDDDLGSGGSSAVSGGICTPETAYDFVYPVSGQHDTASDRNSIDPREDGWYVQNGFAHTCPPPSCGNSGTHTLHSGEDKNYAPWSSTGERDCSSGADVDRFVYAIANGVVVLKKEVRAGGSYRYWVVVIRHVLSQPTDISPYLPSGATIPESERRVSELYSVYLHINPVAGLEEGDCVTKAQQIGGIANMSSGPHLHFEINRPSPAYLHALAGRKIAGTNDGYYPSNQALADFGHLYPSRFIRDHRITWHPAGTVVQVGTVRFLLTNESGRLIRRRLRPEIFSAWRFDPLNAVSISSGEADCYDIGADVEPPPAFAWYRTTEVSTVYRVDLVQGIRQGVISSQSLFSWGYTYDDVTIYDLEEWSYNPYGDMPIREPLRLRDGTLFRTFSDPRVYVVTSGMGRHVTDWGLFQAVGYRDGMIRGVGDGTENIVTTGIAAPLTVDDFYACANGMRERSTEDNLPCGSYEQPIFGGGGGECEDLDHDSFFPTECGGTDCDDGLETVYPGATEPCDGRDNNCDGTVDDPFDLAVDRDNCGRCGHVCGPLAECGGGECIPCGGGGQVCCHTGTACRDSLFCTEGTCQAGCISTDEICNGGDDDCDGVVDDGFDLSNDRENCGACHNICTVDQECHVGACRFPPSPETSHACNNVDDDYDGVVDNFTIACTNACGAGLQTCVAGTLSGCVATSPPMEVCNGVDDDCDGSIDEGGICPTVDCDVDGDGVENAACAGPDCDDLDPAVYPGAPERCNGRDDNCNLGVDEGFDFLLDERNCGTCGNVCAPGWTCFSGACSAPCTPTGAEICDMRDNDCDGLVDEGGVCTPPPPACTHRVEISWANDAFWTFGTDIAGSGERLPDLSYWSILTGLYNMVYTDVCPGFVRMNLEARLSPTRWYVESDGAGGFIFPLSPPPVVRVDGVAVSLTAISVPGWAPPAAMRFCVGTCP